MTWDLSTGTLACRAGAIRGGQLLRNWPFKRISVLYCEVFATEGPALLEKCRILFFRYFNVLSCLLLHPECIVGHLSEGLGIGL